MAKKRGQVASGGGAAGLVAIIAGLIILYILFLPPAEREELLGEDGDNGGDNNGEEDINILLSETPGRLDYLKGDVFEIDIPSFNIYKTTSAKEIENYNPFIVRDGWFDKKTKELTFVIDDLDNVDDVLFSFLAKIRKGVLKIDLNENLIFESSVNTLNVEPIRLKNMYLKEGENTLKLSVSGVGALFWRTNEYSLENAKVVGDITDISRQKTRNVFIVEAWKYKNLEKATLKFNPNCVQDKVGILDVLINDRNVFSGVPDCGMLNKYPIPISALDAGTNDVVFKTNKGVYLIDQIKIKIELEELTQPVYYFELSEKEMKNVTDEKADVNLTLYFVDDEENKELDLNVNGHMIRVDQEEAEYSKKINSWVEEGNNYIKLKPLKTIDIVKLEVKLIERDDED